MEIKQYVSLALNSNMYVLKENNRSIIIDPCVDTEWGSSQVDWIILTHEHYDHISMANTIREKYNCPILCGHICGERIVNSSGNFSRYFDALVALHNGRKRSGVKTPDYICHADKTFCDTTAIMWEEHEIILTETPGHSPGSICVIFDNSVLFSGDSLIPANETVIRFPGGNEKDFINKTIPYLQSLPENTVVYPGHYGSFRLWDHTVIQEGGKVTCS